MGGDFDDVPSPIDLTRLDQARAWVADTIIRRPWRGEFFAAIAAELERQGDDLAVLELGSGPGHLAAAVLTRCRVRDYVALDFSPAMHAIAREHLGPLAARVRFETADFRGPWAERWKPVDAVLTMQAAHEVRHKRRLPALLAEVRQVLQPGGLFLFCDHYWQAGTGKHPDLFPTRQEQPQLLGDAGFAVVRLVHEREGLALYACR